MENMKNGDRNQEKLIKDSHSHWFLLSQSLFQFSDTAVLEIHQGKLFQNYLKGLEQHTQNIFKGLIVCVLFLQTHHFNLRGKATEY